MKKEIKLPNEAMALIEMYKAGFLDGHGKPKLRDKEAWIELNKKYKKAFMKRFEKKITKQLKKNK